MTVGAECASRYQLGTTALILFYFNFYYYYFFFLFLFLQGDTHVLKYLQTQLKILNIFPVIFGPV